MKKKIVYGVVLIAGSLFILHVYLLDGLDGWFFSTGFPEDTVYAKGYSDGSFRKVHKGMNREEVLKLLGSPLGQVWKYDSKGWVSFDNGVVSQAYAEQSALEQVKKGMTVSGVHALIGKPSQESLVYSMSPGDMSYRVRVVLIKNDHVSRVIHNFYTD
jgi:outer membrane protein assembly factor BamE (lipoprotein component of BamABCDE complex)